jgi:hypothetical protein
MIRIVNTCRLYVKWNGAVPWRSTTTRVGRPQYFHTEVAQDIERWRRVPDGLIACNVHSPIASGLIGGLIACRHS